VDPQILEKLNRLSLSQSFTPETDIDWSEKTTDEEYAALYPAWSLLEGTGFDADLGIPGRIAFAKYQQMNLMAFTGLLERHGIASLARLYDLDPAQPFREYVGHFIKEETYHYAMFQRGVRSIAAAMPGSPPLPTRGLDSLLRWLFRGIGVIPFRKLRVSLTLLFFQFAEQVTIFAHQMVRTIIPREKSLVAQIWAAHALDEARHLVFDSMVLEQNRLPGPLAWLPRALALPCCALLSFALNANEVWIARQLGVRVGLRHLPYLVRSTRAPFKRRVFGLIRRTTCSSPAA